MDTSSLGQTTVLQLTDWARSAPMADLGHFYLPPATGNLLQPTTTNHITVPAPAQPAPTLVGARNQIPTLVGQQQHQSPTHVRIQQQNQIPTLQSLNYCY